MCCSKKHVYTIQTVVDPGILHGEARSCLCNCIILCMYNRPMHACDLAQLANPENKNTLDPKGNH